MAPTPILGAAACFGLIAHQALFKRVDVDTHPLLIGAVFIAAPFALKHYLNSYSEQYAKITLGSSFLAVGCCVLSLWTSILVYRAFFHRLRKFPGPFPARLSKLWALSQVAKSGMKWYRVDVALHKQYGDYVRTGPRELSITDPKALPLVLGFSAKTFKGPFYDSMEESVSTTTNKAFHKQRRQVWDSSMKSLLLTYGPQVEYFTDTLLTRLRLNVGIPICIHTLAQHYSYDVMTQLAFGESGGFVDGTSDQAANEVLDGLKTSFDALGYMSHVPWLMTLLTTFSLSFLPGPMQTVNNWSNQALIRRKIKGAEKPDLMAYLLKNTKADSRGNNLLFAEARVLLAAGSDTTAIALTEVFIILTMFPQYIDLIRKEIDTIIQRVEFSSQTSYPVLDSIINETLRLYPPTLFGSPRVTPPEGLQVGDTRIPGQTVLYMPVFCLHRDPRNFAQPDDFVPERWINKSEMIFNRSAFMPFSMGSSNCPGKSLALMELRSVIARTLYEFDVSIPDGATLDLSFFRDIKDHFVAGVPKQDLVFTKRSR